MLDEDNAYVQFKLEFLQAAMPAESAIVFGDMYMVDGGYTKKCLDYGCTRALLIDTLETAAWLDLRKENPALDFYKGDFSNPFFMGSFDEVFDIGVAYDILLHQAPLINTMHLILEKVGKRLVIVQPMLREEGRTNTLTYLPGTPAGADLYPLPSQEANHRMFDIRAVNQSHWLWGMTRSFLVSVLQGEGFAIAHEREYMDFPNPRWYWWGCIAERSEPNPQHWSKQRGIPGVYPADW